MKALIDLAGPAARGGWARREHARLQADIVEARLAARAASGDGPAARALRWLAEGVSGRLGAAGRPALPARLARRGRRARPVRPAHAAAPVCRRAAARSFHAA